MKKSVYGVLTVVGAVFALTGLLFLAATGYIWVRANDFDATAVQVQGVICEINHDTVFVDYEYEGKAYGHVRLNSYTSNMYEGMEIDLRLPPDAPEKAQAAGLEWLLCWIFGGLGALFALLGGGFLLSVLRKSAFRRRLMAAGRPVEARVTGGEMNRYVAVNGRHPWKLECTDDTGRIFHTANVRIHSLDQVMGQPVTVYLDPYDDEVYWVEMQ